MENKEFFDVISLSREDFKAVGFDAEKLTDGQMQRVASKIADVCMEQFWISLEWWGEELNLPKCKDK